MHSREFIRTGKRAIVVLSFILSFLLPLGAERITNAYFSLDIPDGLVVDSSTGETDDGGYILTLRQKGYNWTGNNNYTSVVIRILDSGEDGYTNELFKEAIKESSSSKLDEIFEAIELGCGFTDNSLRKYSESMTLDGYYFIHSCFEGKGLVDKSKSTVVDAYATAIGRYYVYITTYYFKDNEGKSLPLINSVLSSLRFLIKENGEEPIVLYENNLPLSKDSFMYKWPEKNPVWSYSNDGEIITRTLDYSDDECYMSLSLGCYLETVSQSDFNAILPYLKDDIVAKIKKKYSAYSVRVTGNTIYNNSAYIAFEYSLLGIPLYGNMYIRYIGNNSFVLIVTITFDKTNAVRDEVVKSFGFRTDI